MIFWFLPIGILTIYYLCFLFYVLYGFIRLKLISIKQDVNIRDKFISILIPFRNEAENILNNLQSIQNINYDVNKYEVIYINDNSTDNSVELLETNIKNRNIKVINCPTDLGYEQGHKKIAVNYGINNAKGEIIFTTDSDCIVPVEWINTMLVNFNDNTAFVSGPVNFIADGTMWSKLQQIEFAGLVLAGGGLIAAGKPTICNAANIAFKKSVFFEVGGYSDNMNLSSGDDELLMQKISTNLYWDVNFCYNNLSVVSTSPNKTIAEFYHQRKRWASKGTHYKNKLLVVALILIYLFFLSFPLQIVGAIFFNKYFLVSFLLSFSVKAFFEYLIIKKGKNILFAKIETKVFLIAELLHIPYILLAGFLGLFGNFQWKGRKLKR